MRGIIGTILVTCLAVAPTEAAAPQTRRSATPAKRAPAKPNAGEILAGAILLNSLKPGEDLHAACARSNFKLLAIALDNVKARISLEKSEYETAAEFDARREKVEALLNGAGPLIVCQPLNDNEDAPFTYNAERQRFAGSFGATQNVWRDVRQNGSYMSCTRMGVRATVKSSFEFEYNVSFDKDFSSRAGACVTGRYSFDYEVPAPRAEAPALKTRGFLVFTGRLISPFVDTTDTPGEPTLDDPRDVHEHAITVSFEPALVAVAAPGGRPWECKLDQQ